MTPKAMPANLRNKSHPYHRDLQGLNEFIKAYCGGDTQLIACAEAAWYYCMRRNQPTTNPKEVRNAG